MKPVKANGVVFIVLHYLKNFLVILDSQSSVRNIPIIPFNNNFSDEAFGITAGMNAPVW
jgi:hypothetical protein